MIGTWPIRTVIVGRQVNEKPEPGGLWLPVSSGGWIRWHPSMGPNDL
jgi:hypothetical protein